MAMAKITVYSFSGSQWAGVVHLTLAEKGFTKELDYHVQDVDIGAADNFDPAYLEINPNGTIPSLTSTSLPAPLSESTDILRYLDSLRENNPLVPKAAKSKTKGQQIIDLVHSSAVDTNIIFFDARDVEELDNKKSNWQKRFIDTRQHRLEQEHATHPAHPFYNRKLKENGILYTAYQNTDGAADAAFFSRSNHCYIEFAAGLDQLESLLELPYAVGNQITEADFHVIPWLSHAMVAAGSNRSEIHNFSALESTIQKSVDGFKVGPRTREWWANVARTSSFKTVFPSLR
ncbi:hypothetical protein VHEMI08436 [[Torrubiella] hemipterigena]|uniref:GST N-terminal domain-containing protein n=1 Tax=[Torrubiella] hemipterigena TaxID=1531966 RepID=A0A0A1T6R5_9HYPO|nr:hypothetical protein VHEMI08436 [[Torrubiella] hemipterigena]